MNQWQSTTKTSLLVVRTRVVPLPVTHGGTVISCQEQELTVGLSLTLSYVPVETLDSQLCLSI
jgi:hypothetical protein